MRLEQILAADAALGEEDRRAFDEERTQYNVRLIRWLMPLLAASHAAIACSIYARPIPPERASYSHVVLLIQGSLFAWTSLLALVAWQTPKSSAITWVHRYIGDVTTVTYALAGAVLSANAQRLPAMPIQLFLVVTLGSALFRPRATVQLGALAAGLAVVSTGIVTFQVDPFWRASNLSTAVTCACMGVGAFFLVDRYRGRELAARGALRRMNGELEKHVAAQVGEIVARARQIEELNVQLAEKVQERSRELSVALARLADTSTEHDHLEQGTVLGDRVVIDARIGAGGMGTVYRGFDRVTQRNVAVKLVQAASVQELDGLQRFLREALAMASVQHPAVVRSLHVDVSDDGRLFQIMELVSGETLSDRLARGPLIAAVAARVGAILAEALAAAHAAKVIHCDVKPANVMLTSETPGLRLLDFGISLLRDARAASEGTSGGVLGTPAFMAPEQFNGREDITDRADVYALGLVVYECLTLRLPYDVKTPGDWFVAHMAQKPVEIATIVPDLDVELEDVVMRCLRKGVLDRPSAAEVADTLGAVADRLGAPILTEVEWSTAVRERSQAAESDARLTVPDRG